MRPICLAQLDRTRPVLVLTREIVRPHLSRVTVAPITTTIRGLSTEVFATTASTKAWTRSRLGTGAVPISR